MWYGECFGAIPFDSSKLSKKKLAQYETDTEFIITFNDLLNSALETFIWTGLPETCNVRFLERSLILCGKALIAQYQNGYINLAATGGAGYNMYGEYIKSFGYGMNGFNKEYDLYIDGANENAVVTEGAGQYKNPATYNAVLCRDNKLMFPYVNYIMVAAQRLAQAMRSMDVVADNLKQPCIITCEESAKASVEEAMKNRDVNTATIICNGKLPMDTFKVWDTKANPQSLTILWEHYERLQSQIHEILGIKSSGKIEKKERLITDEVAANDQTRNMNLEKRLAERQIFCERLNKAFGLNVSVEINPMIIAEVEKEKEVGENVDE